MPGQSFPQFGIDHGVVRSQTVDSGTLDADDQSTGCRIVASLQVLPMQDLWDHELDPGQVLDLQTTPVAVAPSTGRTVNGFPVELWMDTFASANVRNALLVFRILYTICRCSVDRPSFYARIQKNPLNVSSS